MLMKANARRASSEHRFASHDGVQLFYRRWAARGPADRAVILFHRGHEHGARLQDVVDKLDLPDFEMFAWDARGHGHSPGERGYAEHFGVLVADVEAFVRHVSTTYRVALENVVILGHSVGAVTAAAWVHTFAPPIRALVLATPALRVKLYVPFAIPLLRLLLEVRGKAYVQSYVKARLLTHDPQKIADYESDPLITRQIAVNILLGLYDAGTRLIDDAAAITVPTLMLVSGNDWVVKPAAQHAFFARLGATTKASHTFPGFFHDTLNERDNHLPIGVARAFILERFAGVPERPSLVEADRRGATHAEYEALGRPLPITSPKRWQFALMRGAMGTLGRLSAGVRLGLATGFDSGATLDYVYRNEARGTTFLGRLMDRNYLDAIGWRGIRIRKRHLEQALQEAIETLEAAARPVHVLDIAAGHGRYVLEALAARRAGTASALLRDYDATNVAAAAALAAALGLARVRCEQADAFDASGYAALAPQPTIAIASGLYELFPENAPVMRSLAGLARAVAPGGYLIYTNQPWHPQLEMIARTLTSHRGHAAWVMRRRTQAEIDELVRRAGFEKCGERADQWGIFTVSVARRLEA